MKTANLIEKERISTLHFSKEDVLKDPNARSRRSYDINRATILGNAYRNKAAITFRTDEGELKTVETTVWANDDKFVMLKAGTFLPLKSIVKVENC
ncbi:hypothetical protein FVR03_20875 [Pontibacter qinzhouensis]|uniref:Uncharacterized protein n=1 Tax=Pontibacter qinzhouensis TaxID=2603253 RepID=A0A5C8J0X4_9BACT|nr:hypothetical protein [Pontibacter qinzhouensis]TXK28397.1 hypothetical protein FVR03_20875 [Pontibacter qinzhouensis]